jgi:hypothetical protein
MHMRPGILPVLAGSLILIGCGPSELPRQREEDRSVELGKAERVRAVINMGAGELRIQGGARKLLESHFVYAGGAPPEVRYDETGFRGTLTVSQRSAVFAFGPRGKVADRWELMLNDSIPLDLEAKLGAGQGVLDLRGTNLSDLDVDLGAGQVELNLAGEWRRGFEARIRGGVGQADIRLPKSVAIEADAVGGIGEIEAPGFRQSGHRYTYEPPERSSITIRLNVRGGIGQIRLLLVD